MGIKLWAWVKDNGGFLLMGAAVTLILVLIWWGNSNQPPEDPVADVSELPSLPTSMIANAINNIRIPPAQDISGMATKRELQVLDERIGTLLDELNDTKSAFRRANLYSAEVITMQGNLDRIDELLTVTVNRTDQILAALQSHTGNTTIHKGEGWK